MTLGRRLALLLLAAMLAASSLPTLGQTGGPDLAAEGLHVSGPPPAWLGGAPTPTRLEVTIVNSGPAASFTLAYYWNSTDSSHYLNGDALSSTDGGTLGPGASGTYGVDWTPLPTQKGTGTILVVVSPEGDTKPANNRAALPLTVPVHRLDVAAPAGDLSIRLGETRFLRLRATNLGSVREDLELSVVATAASPLQGTVEPARLDLAPGAHADVVLYVERPATGGPSPDTSFRIMFRNASVPSWSPMATTTAFTATDAALGAGQLATALQAPESPSPKPPGIAFDLPFALANTGQTSDSLRLSAMGPHGWGMQASPMRIALDPGKTTVVRVTGSIPLGEAPGSLHEVTLTATSERGPAGTASAAVAVRVAGAIVPPPTVELPATSYQGDLVTVTVEVRNDGTHPTGPGNITLAAARTVPGLPASKPIPALGPGSSTQATFSFMAAQSEPLVRPGSFAFIDRDGDGRPGANEGLYLAARPNAASDGFVHPEGGGVVRASDVRINTTQGAPGSRLQSDSPDLGAGPYVKAGGPVCLDRDGNGQCAPGDRLYLDLAEPLGFVSTGDVRLDPGDGRLGGSRVAAREPDTGWPLAPTFANRSIAFADANGNGAFDATEAALLDLDLDGVAGPGDLRLTPLLDKSNKVLHLFGSRLAAGDRDNGTRLRPILLLEVEGILGSLRLDAAWTPDEGAVVAAQAATVFIRTAALTVTSPPVFQASPGETLALGVPPRAFEVKNGGNAAERVILRATAGGGTIALTGPDHLLLAPGESRTVPVAASLPASMPDGSVELRLEAWLEDHTETVVQGVAVVELRDLTAPTAAFVDLPKRWTAERDLPIRVRAHDDVGVRAINVTATGGAGGTVALIRDGGDMWVGSLALPAGNFTLDAYAVDGAGRQGVAGPVPVSIATLPPPRLVALSPGDGAILGPAAILDASFDDPAGLAEATLRIDGGPPQTLLLGEDGSSIRGFLGNLTAGTHRLDLSVANTAGVFWNTTFTVTAPAAQTPAPAESARGSPSLGLSWAALAIGFLVGRRRRR
ncbi:MAG: hypothetical protein WC876_06360 [Candidatus Thermoplasmatota archaeon]